jgi:hypothetical protein
MISLGTSQRPKGGQPYQGSTPHMAEGASASRSDQITDALRAHLPNAGNAALPPSPNYFRPVQR